MLNPKTYFIEESIQPLRVDLAAALRLAAEFGWHESVANHFSVATSSDGKQFLTNPKWMHFSAVRASDLLLLDAEDPGVMDQANAPDPSAWTIHGTIHRRLPAARALMHCHPTYSTLLATLKDPTIHPVDQNTARFYRSVATPLDFGGILSELTEGYNLAEALANHSVLLMKNHGVIVSGASIAETFESLYFLERAARTMVIAYSTGRELNVMSDEIARTTAEGWLAYKDQAFAHFDYLKSRLDRTDPSYQD